MARYLYIADKVCTLTKKYHTRSPFELCGELGIGIKYKELGSKIKAFFFYQSRIKTIVLNQSAERELQGLLCAHELGHAVLHAPLLSSMKSMGELVLFDTESITEYEANLFAAELLIDDGEILELLQCGEYSLSQAASMLYVPAELLDFKIRMLRGKGYSIEAPNIAAAKFLKYVSIDTKKAQISD